MRAGRRPAAGASRGWQRQALPAEEHAGIVQILLAARSPPFQVGFREPPEPLGEMPPDRPHAALGVEQFVEAARLRTVAGEPGPLFHRLPSRRLLHRSFRGSVREEHMVATCGRRR